MEYYCYNKSNYKKFSSIPKFKTIGAGKVIGKRTERHWNDRSYNR